MRYFFLLFTVMILSVSTLFAAKPVVILGELPGNSTLELYEDSEELFALKVMEYYQTAISLKIQLILLGVTPVTKLDPPSLEDLQELESKIIKKYYLKAKELEKEVLAVDESYDVILQEELIKCKEDINGLKLKYTNENWNLKNKYNLEKLELIEKLESECNEKLERFVELSESSRNSVDILSISTAANIFLSNSENKIESGLSPSFRVNLNIYKLFGFGRKVDIWYDYMSPYIKTLSRFNNDPDNYIKEEWKSHMHSTGISGKVGNIFGEDKYIDGLKLGLGYFFSGGTIYNKTIGEYNFNGMRFDIEYFGGNFSRHLPVEIIIGGSLYQSFDDGLDFYTGNIGTQEIKLGKTHLAVYMGLRLNIWRSAY